LKQSVELPQAAHYLSLSPSAPSNQYHMILHLEMVKKDRSIVIQDNFITTNSGPKVPRELQKK